MRTLLILMALASPAIAQLPEKPADVIPYTMEVTVYLESASGSGSGTIYTRNDKDYVLSCAHVVEKSRIERKVIKDGQEITLVEFEPIQVSKYYIENGEVVGKNTVFGRVVKYSNDDFGYDLSLIELDKHDVFVKGAVLYSGENLPVGDEIYHVGSLYGDTGYNSFSRSYISQYGRKIGRRSYIQTACTVAPGSSGGPLFTTKGEQYGVVVMRSQADATMNFSVPYTDVRSWLKRAGALWVVDESVPVAELSPEIEVE